MSSNRLLITAVVIENRPVAEVAPVHLADAERAGDLIITVCDRAHEQLHGADWAHWSIPDPVALNGTRAFDRALDLLAARVASLAPRLTAVG